MQLRPLFAAFALAAAAGAQGVVHDVPHRGALVYERQTEQLELDAAQSRLRPQWVIRNDGEDAHRWRYFGTPANAVPAGFERIDFDDRDWPTGQGEFGPDVGKNAAQRTVWRSAVLCLRTKVDLGSKKPKAVLLRVTHDDDLAVFWNGVKVVDRPGVGRDVELWLSGEQLDAWQRGDNTIAVRCTNTGGYQCADLAMAVFTQLPPRARTGEDLAKIREEERRQVDGVRSDLFGGYRMPALLLQGDLEDDNHVRLPPADLRDLAWWMAMDLRCGVTGGSVNGDAWRLYRLGDLAVKGRASAVDVDGWQTLDLSVKNTTEPASRNDSNRFVDRFVKPHIVYGLDARLTVRRRLAVGDGRVRVTEFVTELDGRLLRGKEFKEPAANLQQREHWKFVEVRDGQDAKFRAMVAAAIERGTNRLKADLKNLDAQSLRREPEDADRSYHAGRLALGLLALIKGGVPKDDPVIVAGVAELRRRVLVDTYSLGNALMVLEALHAPPGEFGDLKQGAIDRPRKRVVPDADKQLMQQWADQLLGNLDTRVDKGYLLRFNYVAGPRFDNSVNQYGLLGLYSAHLCGVELPATVWESAINHLLADQIPEGEKVKLDLVDYRTNARRLAAPEEKFTVSTLYARALGWSYEGPKSAGVLSPAYGSMTAAGITGLAICQAALEDYAGQKRIKLQNDASRARNDGFAWMAQNMTMRYHAGSIDRQPRWFYYYLYSLERAALLSGIALIQDRDWYFEGAMVLVLAQQDNGHWPAELHYDLGIERDAMAILFLKQSTMPVLTGR
ncbi:MAG: hypothetical protein KDC48_11750 [Planctomycetes bacterium]|nr:hypothetical protein [Planctomycetota bacterium]